MDKNTEYLNYIYQNSQMGIEAIENLMEVVDDPQTREHLKIQLESCEAISSQALNQLNERGQQEKDISTMKKIMSYISINVQAMIDKTPAHVAEMMMQGNAMGIIDITKNQSKYKDTDTQVAALGNELMKLEEDGFNQWKKYLGIVAA